MSNKNEAIQQFVELTQVPASVAEVILERNQWNVEGALDEFYNGPTQRTSRSESPVAEQAENATRQSASTSSPGSSSSSTKKQASQSRFKSFSQLVKEETPEEENDDEQLFAGGGNGSGLNVENPNNPQNLVQDLLKKAEQGSKESERAGQRQNPRVTRFEGVGYKLGDSVTPSTTIGAPVSRPKSLEKAHRKITFWKDGFQVGEGQLYRYSDPANATFLAELNAGRAPLSLLDVEYGQEVDVEVAKKLDEEYQPPKRKIGGFFGSGHRLGSPVSTDYQPQSPAVVEETKQEKPVEEEQKGDASVQIRFADGRRIVRKIDSNAPVEELYQFVKGETGNDKIFTLNHAFPVKPIEDLKQSIKEAGLVNSVVVQRWVQ